MSADMQLNDVDRSTVCWDKATAYCNTRIAALQREIEGDKTLEQTAKLRGRIAELRSFMRAGEPPREVTGDA